jgi:hypothetical protein
MTFKIQTFARDHRKEIKLDTYIKEMIEQLLKIKQVGSTTYTNTCKIQNYTHAKGRVTFNVDKLNTSYRKEEQWIYDRNKIIQLT